IPNSVALAGAPTITPALRVATCVSGFDMIPPPPRFPSRYVNGNPIDAFRPATERIPESFALRSLCRRPVRRRRLQRRLSIDERVDLCRESIAQLLRLIVGDFLLRESLGDVFVRRDRKSCDQSRPGLVRSGVGDLADARAGQLSGEVFRGEPEVFRRLPEE